MIALTLEGRLGNQLFQYAFIYTAARRLNTSFYLDKSIDNFMLPKYFEVKNDFLAALDNKIFTINGYKNIFNIHSKRAFYGALNNIIFNGKKIDVSNETPATEVLELLKNNYLYKGFFQSERYFEDFKDEIKALYRVKKPYSIAFEQLQKQIGGSKKKVVVHVRRSDYVDLNMSLSLSYYKRAIKNVEDVNTVYIFISDDPDFVEKEFDYIPNKYISRQNEIIDLQFLINADACILSNSSFSWWGAWLNNNANKTIIAPELWLGQSFGREYPNGVIVPEWTLLHVD